jgi:cytochrome bd ubiquinol oxidase subunit II
MTMDLPLFFALIAALAIGLYVVADGFDLGVGVLFLFAPRDRDRDMMMRSIAPMWDGNETWLVFGGALLWAVFPIAYYVLLPAFYLPIMAMLFALIFRGIAFGFRFQSNRFRWVWDYAFAGGSILAVLAQGFILGGFVSGVAVRDGAFAGGSFSWLTILGLLCGVGLLGGYALLGAGWLIWKTSGGTQVFGREVGHSAVLLTAGAMLLVSTWTAMTVPDVAQRWFGWPQILPLALAPLAAAILFVLVWRNLWSSREYRVFALGILIFLLGFAGLAVSLWPYVVPRHATVWSASSDDSGLRFVAVGVLVVLPIVLAYLAHAYWVFHGETTPDSGYDEGGPSVSGRRSSSLDAGLHLS